MCLALECLFLWKLGLHCICQMAQEQYAFMLICCMINTCQTAHLLGVSQPSSACKHIPTLDT